MGIKIMDRQNRQRVISVIAISIISFVGFEALVYVNNLYQPIIYIKLAGFIYLILLIWLSFLFDVHFKLPTQGSNGFLEALGRRFHYMISWMHFRHFVNYLILPGIIYWGTVILVGINFGHEKLQQFIVVVSALALVASYSMFKEIFHVKKTPIENRHFLVLSYVKLYAAWLVYSAALGIVWFYCFPANIFYFVVYFVTFVLLYQALFQFNKLNFRNILRIAFISFVVTLASYFVYIYWNVNYFTAGLFLLAIYNFLWQLLFHILNKSLSREVFFQNFAIFFLIMVMVFGATNFNAKIDRCF